MNPILIAFARQHIKDNLAKCTPKERSTFMLMYSGDHFGADIEYIVDNIPADRLDWAMMQVQRTVDKHEAEKGPL